MQDPEPIVEIHSGNQEEAQTFLIFDFRFLYLIVKIVLYSMIVISHWLTLLRIMCS